MSQIRDQFGVGFATSEEVQSYYATLISEDITVIKNDNET
jgi:hypothetical protein